jgi:hypothetical protein
VRPDSPILDIRTIRRWPPRKRGGLKGRQDAQLLDDKRSQVWAPGCAVDLHGPDGFEDCGRLAHGRDDQSARRGVCGNPGRQFYRHSGCADQLPVQRTVRERRVHRAGSDYSSRGDGTQVYGGTPETNDGSCASIGTASNGVAEFLHAQPCKSTVKVDIPVETTKFADGKHALKVELEDAAQNRAVVLDRQVSFANQATSPTGGSTPGSTSTTGSSTGSPSGSSSSSSSSSVVGGGVQVGPGSPTLLRGAPNGVNASDQATLSARWVKTSKASLTSSYGVADRVSGRLTAPGGLAISGASIGVYETAADEGAQTQLLGNVSTGPTGGWTLTLPRGVSSGSLSFAYRSHANDTVPAATRATASNSPDPSSTASASYPPTKRTSHSWEASQTRSPCTSCEESRGCAHPPLRPGYDCLSSGASRR